MDFNDSLSPLEVESGITGQVGLRLGGPYLSVRMFSTKIFNLVLKLAGRFPVLLYALYIISYK